MKFLGEVLHPKDLATKEYVDKKSGVYVGSGTPPAGTKVQVDPDGEAYAPGTEVAGRLFFVNDDGNVAFLQLGAGLEIRNGRLCVVGTVTPDEPDEPAETITFTQTGENSVTVSGVVFEQQADGTVLWRCATFIPGEGNTVIVS